MQQNYNKKQLQNYIKTAEKLSRSYYSLYLHHLFSPSTEQTPMSKLNEISQILMFSLLVIILVLAPLLSSSLRTLYLYIITNLLIIALGAQAGLLSYFSEHNSDHDKKSGSGDGFSFAPKPVVPTVEGMNMSFEKEMKMSLRERWTDR